MKRQKGIRLLKDISGTGDPAEKGDRVTYNLRLFLNRGDEIPLDDLQRQHVPPDQTRVVDGRVAIDRVTTLGKRDVVPAVEYALIGMKVGGYRKLRASPHLAYRQEGIPGLVPGDAVLIVELWVRAIHGDTDPRPAGDESR